MRQAARERDRLETMRFRCWNCGEAGTGRGAAVQPQGRRWIEASPVRMWWRRAGPDGTATCGLRLARRRGRARGGVAADRGAAAAACPAVRRPSPPGQGRPAYVRCAPARGRAPPGRAGSLDAGVRRDLPRLRRSWPGLGRPARRPMEVLDQQRRGGGTPRVALLQNVVQRSPMAALRRSAAQRRLPEAALITSAGAAGLSSAVAAASGSGPV